MTQTTSPSSKSSPSITAFVNLHMALLASGDNAPMPTISFLQELCILEGRYNDKNIRRTREALVQQIAPEPGEIRTLVDILVNEEIQFGEWVQNG